MVTLAERLKSGCTVMPSGCWEWHRYRNDAGYGCLSVGNKKTEAYRASYETFVGPVPTGLELDHLCRNRGCINPDHLEPVTKKVNVLRGFNACANNARKTRCKHGHELTAIVESGRNRRRCLTCQDAAVARYQARKRTERLMGLTPR